MEAVELVELAMRPRQVVGLVPKSFLSTSFSPSQPNNLLSTTGIT